MYQNELIVKSSLDLRMKQLRYTAQMLNAYVLTNAELMVVDLLKNGSLVLWHCMS